MSSEKPIIGLLVFLTILGLRIGFRASFRNAGSEQVEDVEYVVDDLETLIATSDGVNALLESVKDHDSALSAAPKIPGVFQEYCEELEILMEDMLDYIASSGEEFRVSALNKREFEELDERALQLSTRFEQKILVFTSHIERISELEGLPAEFWDVFRLETMRASLTFLGLAALDDELDLMDMSETAAMVALLEEHGPRRVVTVTLVGASQNDLDDAQQKCSEIAGGDAQVSQWYDEDLQEGTIVIAPTDQFEQFASAVPNGAVALRDEARRAIAFEMGAAASALAIAPSPREEIASTLPPRVETPPARAEQPQPTLPADVPGTPEVSEEELARAQQTLDSIVSALMANAPAALPALPGMVADAVDEKGLPLPGNPNYYRQLAQLMVNAENSLMRDDAIDALLLGNPREIEDKEVHKQIARNFHQLLSEDKNGGQKEKAIQGLVLYGGRYSVPILVRLLEDGNLREQDAVFAGLVRYPTEEATAAVAGLLGDGTNHDRAVDCLREMGSAAEQALIDAAPSEEEKVTLTAIDLLGEVGTAKSYPLLRKAITKTKKPDVKARAKAALKSIQQRISGEKQAA